MKKNLHFDRKFLHFFKKFLVPLEIFLQKIYQNFLAPPRPKKNFLTPTLSPRFLANLMYAINQVISLNMKQLLLFVH
jgi:hypothetical protein